ncbi:MAG: serine/threonine protein kinase [Anaerolineae bacterium]|nr:serine/threonine protein kinase [Anaerolineae bacterium]NUQ04380.1 protein kinase [Anaerolineae bacterium]
MGMEVGTEFSQYRVIEHIGRGGMADVWSARDKRLNRTVAIKTVARDLSQDVNPVRLFEREARTIASLEHPHILPIYEFGEYEGQLYIVMRYVSGGSLEDLLEEGPMSVEETLRLARLVAHALDYAHSNQVIHLDLKPSNILLDSYRQPYLADFGLAAVLGPEGRAANPGSGTLLYMAPEQLTSEVLDHRADIFSFSVMVFHMLTGQLPFDATVPLALKQIQLNESLPAIDKMRRELPGQFTTVLRGGTNIDPGKRPATLGDIVSSLEGALEKTPAPVSGILVRPAERRPARPDEMDTATARLDSDLLSDSLDNLITRTKPELNLNTDLDALISGPGDGLITGPKDRIIPGERTTQLDLGGLDDFSAIYDLSPEAMALREAVDIYNRAHRAWMHGQGRFLLGITHFMLINDYYLNAEKNALSIDQSGMEMMLRGALEYDQDIAAWWARVDNDGRRKVCLHAIRSESAPARVRALSRLEDLPDADPPQIARLVAQTLQSDTNEAAQIAAIQVLEKRARFARAQQDVKAAGPRFANLLTTARSSLRLTAPSDWRAEIFGSEIDEVLATLALEADSHATRERAARAIGRIRSEVAIKQIADRQRQGERGALRALAYIRDEAPQLPASVSRGARLFAWLDNTWRRLTENPLSLFLRYASGFFFGAAAFWWYAYSQISSAAIFFAERWGKSLSTGATVGLVIGLVVLLAGALVERLRGFWHWWARLIVSAGLGYLTGLLVWNVFTWFFLYFEPDASTNLSVLGLFSVSSVQAGALGFAAAFVLRSAFNVPAVIAMLFAAAAIYLPIYVTWEQFAPPLIYTRQGDHINNYAFVMALLMGIGAYLPTLLAQAWALLRRRRPASVNIPPAAAPPPAPTPTEVEPQPAPAG